MTKLFFLIACFVCVNNSFANVRIACGDLPSRVLFEEARKILKDELPYGLSSKCTLERVYAHWFTSDEAVAKATCLIGNRYRIFTVMGDNSGGILRELNCEGFYLTD